MADQLDVGRVDRVTAIPDAANGEIWVKYIRFTGRMPMK